MVAAPSRARGDGGVDLGEPEVGDLGRPRRVEEDVEALQVAVDDAVQMQELQALVHAATRGGGRVVFVRLGLLKNIFEILGGGKGAGGACSQPPTVAAADGTPRDKSQHNKRAPVRSDGCTCSRPYTRIGQTPRESSFAEFRRAATEHGKGQQTTKQHRTNIPPPFRAQSRSNASTPRELSNLTAPSSHPFPPQEQRGS